MATLFGPIEVFKDKIEITKNTPPPQKAKFAAQKNNTESGIDKRIRALGKDPNHITLQDIMDVKNQKLPKKNRKK